MEHSFSIEPCIELYRMEKNMEEDLRERSGDVDITLGSDEVINRIKQLQSNGTINKKQVKQQDPELMRSALYYFPSWEHALKNAELV
jgi:hypothetical protein